jgi:hypothetical protein
MTEELPRSQGHYIEEDFLCLGHFFEESKPHNPTLKNPSSLPPKKRSVQKIKPPINGYY